ncbi:MAG: hypothetical protein MJZ65_00315 [Paludibacteraceae bacterium]|nr:hypothetical protein [Paludibacteraceae bacterium]
MDKRKKIVLIVVAVVVLCIVGMRTCTKEVGHILTNILPNAALQYDHPECYSIDSVGSADEDIQSIYIEWGTGNVDMYYADVPHITWKETFVAGEPIDPNLLHYWVHDHRVDLQFCDSGRKDIRLGKKATLVKDLVVYIPLHYRFNRVNVITMNGNNTIEIDANEIDISSVNGCNTLTTRSSNNIDLHTVNGNVTLCLPDTAAFEAEVSKVNGLLTNDFECTQDGNTYICGEQSTMEVNLAVVNGIIQIQKIHD